MIASKPASTAPDSKLVRPEGPLGGLDSMVLARRDRGRSSITAEEPKWHECLAFLDNDHYVETSAITGRMERLETREDGNKPRHRVRLTRNRYTPAIINEASAVAARIPVYECDPINADPGPVGACRLGEKALLVAYDKVSLKNVALDMAQYALTVGAGISWTRWNPDVGEVVAMDGTNVIRQGALHIDVFHQGEVMWEGEFYDAKYWFVRKAQPAEEVTSMKGYIGPSALQTDAMSAPYERRRGEEMKGLVYVHHYLERPTDKYPSGRWLQFVGDQLIAQPQPYPDPKGEPVLHWIPYLRRRHRNRPMGMGELMLDIQRTYNRTISQITAYKNLVLNPQVFAPVGALRQQLSEEPGAIFQYRPVAGLKPEWRDMPDLPVGLFKVLDQCLTDWEEITGSHQLPMGVDSGSGIQAVNERENNRRAVFLANVSDWYARVGMAMVRLMQQHYTEQQLMLIQGRFGTEMIDGFLGSQLYGIAQVRVSEGSIAPRTKEAQRALIMALVDKGLVDPKKAIQALNAGTSDILIDDYELDVEKQKREVQQLVQMGLMQGQGVPMVDEEADGHQVHLDVLHSWMKTIDFERQPAAVQEAARIHSQWHTQALQGQQMQQIQLQTAAAEQLGAQNAAAPQAPGAAAKPMPSTPSMESSAKAANA